jgi:transcriptional regulator with XRE-family HTH domain
MMEAEQGTIADAFGETLQRLRTEAELSQEHLSALAGLHRTEIGMLERGVRMPRLDTILKLAGALGLQPGALIPDVVWRAAPPAKVGTFLKAN